MCDNSEHQHSPDHSRRHTCENGFSRRRFITTLSGVSAGLIVGSLPGISGASVVHPEPRPGIDASLVMTGKNLAMWPDYVQKIYNQIREIPEIADGIGCTCWCKALPTYRSLLTCYYDDGMAFGCDICQGEAKLVYRRHKEGQSLEQIRRAIDARYG